MIEHQDLLKKMKAAMGKVKFVPPCNAEWIDLVFCHRSERTPKVDEFLEKVKALLNPEFRVPCSKEDEPNAKVAVWGYLVVSFNKHTYICSRFAFAQVEIEWYRVNVDEWVLSRVLDAWYSALELYREGGYDV